MENDFYTINDLWSDIDSPFGENTCIVIVPSMSVDPFSARQISGFNFYEERLLCLLSLLKKKHLNIIYITSLKIYDEIIDYYLQFIAGVPISESKRRLHLLSVEDTSSKSLTQKILERPRFIEAIRKLLIPRRSCIYCFNSTPLESQLAKKLKIPIMASDNSLNWIGTKYGSREIFEECNLNIIKGSNLIYEPSMIPHAIYELMLKADHNYQFVIKLNEAFSGFGNAILDISALKKLSSSMSKEEKVNAVSQKLKACKFASKNIDWEMFEREIKRVGCVVEVFLVDKNASSPSVQVFISPDRKISIVSAHEQILGGFDGLKYQGCLLPCNKVYFQELKLISLKIGELLASIGVIDFLSIDFLCIPLDSQEVKSSKTWKVYPLEINLRKGGTTHPLIVLNALTGGHYCQQDGYFYAARNERLFYISSDSISKESYKGITPIDLFEIIVSNNLGFDFVNLSGAFFHFVGALSEFGKFGVTCIGHSSEEAVQIYRNVERVLDEDCFINS